MEELTQEQIIQNCMEFGVFEIIDQEVIPNEMRTRITKAQFSWQSYTLIYEVEYLNPVTSNSIYAVKNERRELV